MKTSRTISFDGWVFRADIGELVKEGRKVRLQQRPLLVLEELLAHPGDLVTREQLIARLWPKGVVDFDTGLNTAVSKLRVALDDVGEVPRYIETIPRKGYRFIGTIDLPAAATLPPAPVVAPVPVPPEPELPPTNDRRTASRRAADTMTVRTLDPSRGWIRYVLAAVFSVVVAGVVLHVRRDPTTVTLSPPAEELARRDLPTIAVLPLQVATTTEPDETLGKVASDVLRQRLGRLDSAVVIGATNLNRATMDAQALRAFGSRIHARYLLDGKVVRNLDQLRLELALFDAVSGERLWSFEESRVVKEFTGLVDDAARGVASHLRLRTDSLPEIRADAPIDVEAYGIYLRAVALMDNLKVSDAQLALELERRATVLDPNFARGYLGLGQALILSAGIGFLKTPSDQQLADREALAAFDRALALDPNLGEVLIERARLTDDPVEAERLYREGLRLAPNNGIGHQRYAEFLFDEYRRGEAIEEMDRARAIEPLRARIHLRQALFRMLTTSDVDAHDRLVQEALDINPRLVLGISQLADSRHLYRGEFADAIRLVEEAIKLDPESDELKIGAAGMYLDVDDPDAAVEMVKLRSSGPGSLVEVALYQRDRRRAAQLARDAPVREWRVMFAAPEAYALRDEAIATGDFALALAKMGERYALAVPWGPPKKAGVRDWNRGLGLVYAHTLVLAGEVQRGRKVALDILAQLDGESVGRAPFFLSRDRAAALMILGEKDKALEELGNSLATNHYYAWFYLGEADPLWAGVHSDPRFQALVAKAKAHRVRQRALLEEMRRTGKVPKRG